MTVRTPTPSLQIKDAAFDIRRTDAFCLAIELCLDGITVTVLDNLTNDYLAFEHYPLRKLSDESALAQQFKQLVEEHEWLGNGFKRTDVMIVAERFTLIPASLFDSAHAIDYLRFNHPIDETTDIVLSDLLHQCDARNLYAANQKLIDAIKNIFPGVRIRHHLSPLIDRTLSVNKNSDGRRVLAHVQQNRFDLLITDSSRLLLANSYRYQTAEDFIYYLLFACEQLKINPDKMLLEIVGEVESKSGLMDITRKYVREVHLGNRPVDARFAKGFEQLPSHFYHNLFALHYYA